MNVPLDKKGYMLIEALIAIGIFSIGFLALATLVFSTTRANTSGNMLTQANMLARQTMEQLKSTTDITTLPSGATTINDPHNPIDAYGVPGGIYNRSWTIRDSIGFNTSREIEVTVSWTWRDQNRRVVLHSITRGRGI